MTWFAVRFAFIYIKRKKKPWQHHLLAFFHLFSISFSHYCGQKMQDESENRTIIFVTSMQLVLIRNIHLRVSSHYQRVGVRTCLLLSYPRLSSPSAHASCCDWAKWRWKWWQSRPVTLKPFIDSCQWRALCWYPVNGAWSFLSERHVHFWPHTKSQQNVIMLCVSARVEAMKDVLPHW